MRVVRAEGVAAALDRARDRIEEWRADRSARPIGETGFGHAPILNVLGFPAVARLGGVPIQLRRRLAFEAGQRPSALLTRRPGGWRLDRRDVDVPYREVLCWDAPEPTGPVLDDAGDEDTVSRALEATDARALHLEGLAGLAPRSMLRAVRGTRLIVTVHDFTPYCPRPHLWEAPASRFCAFSRDEARCHACLSADFAVPRGFEREWRAAMADLLAAADAIVYPSSYLRDAWRALLPQLDPQRQHVIEPGASEAHPPASRPARPLGHVALVGAATAAKGAALLPEIVRATDLRFTVLGGGDAALLGSLRGLPRTRVRGYYRAGTLPRQLLARGVDVALLLSLVPESYGMTLDECWRAGVPVVAFDHGAIAERTQDLCDARSTALERHQHAAAQAPDALRDGTTPRPDVPLPAALTTPAQAARTHLLLYRRLDLLA